MVCLVRGQTQGQKPSSSTSSRPTGVASWWFESTKNWLTKSDHDNVCYMRLCQNTAAAKRCRTPWCVIFASDAPTKGWGQRSTGVSSPGSSVLCGGASEVGGQRSCVLRDSDPSFDAPLLDVRSASFSDPEPPPFPDSSPFPQDFTCGPWLLLL